MTSRTLLGAGIVFLGAGLGTKNTPLMAFGFLLLCAGFIARRRAGRDR